MIKKIFLCIICTLFFLTGCENKKNGQQIPYFVDLTAFKELNDGWVAYLYIETLKKDVNKIESVDNIDLNQIQSIFFDVVNLKYNKLDDFYIPIKDENGKIVEKFYVPQPSYVQSIYSDEMIKINNFLTAKKYNKEITIQDLEECQSILFDDKILDKQVIVELYNDALKHDSEFQYKFLNVEEANTISNDLIDGSRMQFSFIKNFSDLGICEIEYIYKDGTYLSDLVLEHKANEQQIKLQKMLDEIEEELIISQKIDSIQSTGDEKIDKAIINLLNKALNR